jgi:nicotinamidase-related amidase
VERCALIVVDVQRGFEDPQWGPRNNPACESNVAALIAEWRETGRPLVFVRHDSADPGSPLAPGTAGNEFKDVITGEPDVFVTKQVNSAFYGDPPLDPWLRAREVDSVAICGITTNHCCETTARMAANLGYRVLFVGDATHTFDRAALDGTTIPADLIQKVTEANLQGEFADVVKTASLLHAAGA